MRYGTRNCFLPAQLAVDLLVALREALVLPELRSLPITDSTASDTCSGATFSWPLTWWAHSSFRNASPCSLDQPA